jgi:hypothetical protein
MCDICHVHVRATDYYCFNCGKNLHPIPPSIRVESQLLLYIGSFLLPPMGIFWGWKYIAAKDTITRVVGLVAICITLISLFVSVKLTMNFINSIGSQMSQYQNLGGF